MHASAYIRRLSRHFSISAPRMAVRTELGWPWRAGIALSFLAFAAAIGWWVYGLDQFGHHDVAQVALLVDERAEAQREAAALRGENAQLASDLAMMRGVQATLQRQQAQLAQENAALKDELSFLQSFFADATKHAGPAIHRLALDVAGPGIARYSVLVVRGARAKGEFDGHLALVADLVPTPAAPEGSAALSIALPDGADSAGPMKLRFRHYQRLEGTLQFPAGYEVRAVTARAYETGATAPRASRTLTLH